ncbi:MAG: hypothetical protein C0475_01065 [Planctomyces sp.]|nr:hypothetical protein [Planctomyces sp.]MBA4039557.1 hypothetical protein [Planctomyces sp.]MBA4120314.1 hypothetical protein [Isosphaera sp.]
MPPSPSALRLSLTSTDGRGLVVPIGPAPLTIGRQKGNTLVIEDDAASRQHCVIEPDGRGGWLVRDLGSRNGTKLNGLALRGEAAVLAEGDALKVGTHTFAVERERSIADVRQHARAVSLDEAPDMAWSAELRGTLEGLPPRGEGDDPVTVINADGSPSAVLSAEAAAPLAVRLLLLICAKARATDLHLEPKAASYVSRMRVDGQMVPLAELPDKVGQAAVGLIRTACQMKLAAETAVQDGHFGASTRARRVDYRVSITPTVHGPKLVLRVLDGSNAPRGLGELGLPGWMLERVRRVTQKEQGFVLTCGPTGSGKTTTLYNCLREIDRDTSNVVTIEDPVEYQLDGTTQIPINHDQGNTFSNLLRSVLRQDPDVILVGEIRDEETARTAMQAAMTGHLVFSTVHSKDSISAVFRLLDLKVEPYLVASSLDLVVAQRLVRTLCETCKRPVRVTPGQATRLGKHLDGRTDTYTPVGCASCLRTGYRGRRAVFELLDFTDELRDIVLKDPTITAIKRVIEKGLFSTLQQSSWQLVARGVTDLDEADRVAGGSA